MTLPNIALFGLAGSGKDTAGDYLASTYNYTKISFAGPLKELALSIDPVVSATDDDYGHELIRLSEEVGAYGWEHAKRTYPETRRFLRSLGAAMRDQDPDYWLDIAMTKIATASKLNMPVVVTDVRHQNEFDDLSLTGFTTVRIDRPGIDTSDVDPESQRLIESVTPDWTIGNYDDIRWLHLKIETLLKNF